MIRHLFFSFITLILLPSPAKALPCLDNALPLANIGVTVYPDCTESEILYFVPQELRVSEHQLSGTKSFQWKEDAHGNVKVLIRSKLFVDQSKIMRALKDLKQQRPKRYRLKAFELRDIEFSGFGDEGIESQKIVSGSDFSDGDFSLLLTLNERGKQLWKEAAEFGLWSLSSATISYKIVGQSAGLEDLRRQTHNIEIESLPACAILGEECPKVENETRLIKNGQEFGRSHFQFQYVDCGSFRDASLVAPTAALFDDPSLTTEERWIAHKAAAEGFQDELSSSKGICKNYLDEYEGRDWFAQFTSDRGISCASLHQWPFTTIIAQQFDRNENWHQGVRSAYQTLLASCSVFEGFNCNEMNGGRCHGKLTADKKVCFQPQDFSGAQTLTQGSCLLSLAVQNSIGSWIQAGLKTVLLAEARSGPVCVNANTALTENSYRVLMDCR